MRIHLEIRPAVIETDRVARIEREPPGGEHAGGVTHNALVCFADGSYLEIVAFRRSSFRPRSWSSAETRRARTAVHPAGRGRVWTDVTQADRITVTDVAAYSKAYFELVRQLPEVAPYLSVGDEVLIAGRRASVRVGGSGVKVWQPGQLAEVVRNFRGT